MSAGPRAELRGVGTGDAKRIDSPSRILALVVAGIGDLVLATPALRALRETFSSAEITLLTSRKAAPLASTIPLVDQVQPFETPESLLRSRGFLTTVRQFRLLHHGYFDVLVNLYPVSTMRGHWTMRFLNRVVAARQTVGRNADGRGAFYNLCLTETCSTNGPHEADRMLELVGLMGATTEQRRPAVWIPPRYAERASRWFSGTRKRLVIHAGSEPHKRWAAERYRHLAAEIYRKWDADIFWIGSPDEREWIESVCAPLQFGSRNLVGECGLLEVGGLLQQSDLFICNDSGPMHIAAALGVPLVALFGGGYLHRFDPRRTEPRSRVVAASTMNEVSVDEVIQAADDLLAQRRQDRVQR